MKPKCLLMLASAAMLSAAASAAVAAERKPVVDIGKNEYVNSCALCHGLDGKAGGTVNELLKKAPPDLTTLAKRNGGVFPFQRVYSVIDGREGIKAHGSWEMPAWGSRYSTERTKAAEYYMDVPYDMEMFVRSRILALIDYLNRIQVK